MKSAGPMMLAAMLAASLMIAVGCRTITNTQESGTNSCCVIFEPIYVSPEDTKKTKRQIYEHNAAYEEVCGESADDEKTAD